MSTQTAPTAYQPPNQAGAASAFQTGASQLLQGGQSIQNIAQPGYSSLYAGATNNPYASGAQNVAGQVAGLGQGVGTSEIGAGQSLQTLSGQLGSYIPGVLSSGFDPNSALYNQQQQTNQAQQQAINAANGVAGSPYGAGLTGQSNQNFNLNWQAQEQARQLAALSGASGLASTQSGLSQAGAGLEGQGLGTIQSSGMLPNQTYNANQQNIAQMLNALVSGDTSAFGLTQQGVTDQATYLGIGQNATQLADQAAAQNNALITQGLSGLGSLLGSVGGDLAYALG